MQHYSLVLGLSSLVIAYEVDFHLIFEDQRWFDKFFHRRMRTNKLLVLAMYVNGKDTTGFTSHLLHIMLVTLFNLVCIS